MRISELSRSSGVPVATIKYYLREGLLHDGVRTSATQAQYDDSHLARLGLIRALLGAGGLTVAATKRVLGELDHPPDSMHDLLGSVTLHLAPDPGPEVDLAEAEQLVAALGWTREHFDQDHLRPLAEALQALRSAGFPLSEEQLLGYGRAMRAIAEEEVDGVPTDSPEAA